MAAPPEAALVVQQLYAELHDLSATDATEDLRGGFAVKTVAGGRYWYHQVWDGRRRVQRALGPETPGLLAEIAARRGEAARWRAAMARRRQIVRALKAALGVVVDPLAARLIERLARGGLFASGGVLIGTHAYAAYGPMLGIGLRAAALRTTDIDVAADDGEGPPVAFPDLVEAVDPDFFVVPARPGSRIATALKRRGAETRIELLTPQRSGKPWVPIVIERLGFGAVRTPYLDYLLEAPVAATLAVGAGVRIAVPRPARFAWHKLIVAANRDPSRRTKAAKDLVQAATLLSALRRLDARELHRALRALKSSGRGHLAKARAGAAMLDGEDRDWALSQLG